LEAAPVRITTKGFGPLGYDRFGEYSILQASAKEGGRSEDHGLAP
jgi:hypothetical protein